MVSGCRAGVGGLTRVSGRANTASGLWQAPDRSGGQLARHTMARRRRLSFDRQAADDLELVEGQAADRGYHRDGSYHLSRLQMPTVLGALTPLDPDRVSQVATFA